MAKRKRSWEEDLAEVDQKDNESLNEDNESLMAVAQKLRIQHEYVHLVGAINGERYHFPGVGTAPAFLVPEQRFSAQELIGKYLIALKPCQDGFQIIRQERPTSVTRQPLWSPKPVSGFLDQQGNQRRYGSLGAMADVSGTVQVLFGDEPVNEEVEEMQPLDVSGISTPPSDEDRVTLDE